jgi:MFS family permease
MEALVIEHEPPGRVPHMVGIYNCTWSGSAALAYFTGGPLYDWIGAGAVFGVPAAIFAAEFILVLWLRRAAARMPVPPVESVTSHHPEPAALGQPVGPETFLRLAWLASPLSYVAIYSLLAVVPGLANRFGLSASEVGILCSVWFFGRLVAFVGLWQWTGWHYRFRWLGGGYVLLVISFATILLSPVLWLVVAAQIIFGLATGLIYYSSLFYSMDVGEAKAEHGGWHEAMIGVGIFAGPAVAAASLHLLPSVPQAGVWAVTAVLVAGLVAITSVWLRARGRRN